MLLVATLFLTSLAANASGREITRVIKGIYSQALIEEGMAVDSLCSDTVVYTGVFQPAGDSVSIGLGASEKIDVWIRNISADRYVTYFGCNNWLTDSLVVTCENGHVFVGDDRYTLTPGSYDTFRSLRSVLALSHLLIDCLGDYPQDVLKLLNLNWGVDYYPCYPVKAVTWVQSPHSDMKYRFEATYVYDEHARFVEVVQDDRYSRKVVRRDAGSTQYEIIYNYGDRLSGRYVQTCHPSGKETIEGNYIQVPLVQEFYYKQEFGIPGKTKD